MLAAKAAGSVMALEAAYASDPALDAAIGLIEFSPGPPVDLLHNSTVARLYLERRHDLARVAQGGPEVPAAEHHEGDDVAEQAVRSSTPLLRSLNRRPQARQRNPR